MRGLRHHGGAHELCEGIIPARAGFTRPGTGRRERRPDHPRACGVYQVRTLPMQLASGSSPRVRGLQREHGGRGSNDGIIPARAGFTCTPCGGSSRTSDHPRACGVYGSLPLEYPEVDGSSPRVRGLHHGRGGLPLLHGIIPARAGFTRAGLIVVTRDRDHPRACGVYVAMAVYDLDGSGSSPRVRGLPLFLPPRESARGIIPARAGFTSPRRGHPH